MSENLREELRNARVLTSLVANHVGVKRNDFDFESAMKTKSRFESKKKTFTKQKSINIQLTLQGNYMICN